MNKNKQPNLIIFGMESLRRDHMSLYGYDRLTTPYISKYLEKGVIFDNCFSPAIPTTPGYASMLTGKDSFSTTVVSLHHRTGLPEGTVTLPELLKENGYNTTCIGFPSTSPSARGFDKYDNYSGWGSWEEGRSHKAENLNAVTLPEIERLAAEDKPFFLFLRHMDPHSPYLPPEPYSRMFYQKDEFDKNNKSLEPVYNFKPFCDYFYTWFPPGCTDADYITAQYDGEIAYMDACIQIILEKLNALGIEDETLVVFTSDHGETLYDHDCYFDHHGLYDCTLIVPFAFRFSGRVDGGKRIGEYCYLKDICPTILDLMGIQTDIKFDGRNLMPLLQGGTVEPENEFYITECTWQRKHGIRTKRWKYFKALEPDFHYKPEIELYDLENDPGEMKNIAEVRPDIVKLLEDKLAAHIAKREEATGRAAPILNINLHNRERGFESSDEAYEILHIGDPEAAKRMQASFNKGKGDD